MYTYIPFRIIGILTRYAFLCKRMTQFYPQLKVLGQNMVKKLPGNLFAELLNLHWL